MSHAITTSQVGLHPWRASESIVSLTIYAFKNLTDKMKQHLHKTG